jgi:hypothetical protein
MRPRSPAAAAFASAHEHRRLMQKDVVVDLFDEKIRRVGPRDEPRMSNRADRPTRDKRSSSPIGQDHGTHDHPVELAAADDAFLHVLVVIDAPRQQMKCGVKEKPAAAAAVARPKARHGDQLLDLSLAGLTILAAVGGPLLPTTSKREISG